MKTPIPTGGPFDAPAIGSDVDSSGSDHNDTPITPDTTGKNGQKGEDSANKDTQTSDDKDFLLSQIKELKSSFSDMARKDFEEKRAFALKNPDYLDTIAAVDKSLADRIVKDVAGNFGYEGVKSYDELLEAVNNVNKYKDSPELLEIVKDKENMSKELSEVKTKIQEAEARDMTRRIQDYLYSQYPDVLPANDPGDKKYIAWQEKFLTTDPSLSYEKRVKQAYKWAFDEVDEDATEALQKSMGALKKSGGTPISKATGKSAISSTAMELGKRLFNLSSDDFEKYGSTKS